MHFVLLRAAILQKLPFLDPQRTTLKLREPARSLVLPRTYNCAHARVTYTGRRLEQRGPSGLAGRNVYSPYDVCMYLASVRARTQSAEGARNRSGVWRFASFWNPPTFAVWHTAGSARSTVGRGRRRACMRGHRRRPRVCPLTRGTDGAQRPTHSRAGGGVRVRWGLEVQGYDDRFSCHLWHA